MVVRGVCLFVSGDGWRACATQEAEGMARAVAWRTEEKTSWQWAARPRLCSLSRTTGCAGVEGARFGAANLD